VGNMVANVYVKFNYERLRIDRASGIFRKYMITTTRTITTFVALGDHSGSTNPFDRANICNRKGL